MSNQPSSSQSFPEDLRFQRSNPVSPRVHTDTPFTSGDDSSPKTQGADDVYIDINVNDCPYDDFDDDTDVDDRDSISISVTYRHPANKTHTRTQALDINIVDYHKAQEQGYAYIGIERPETPEEEQDGEANSIKWLQGWLNRLNPTKYPLSVDTKGTFPRWIVSATHPDGGYWIRAGGDEPTHMVVEWKKAEWKKAKKLEASLLVQEPAREKETRERKPLRKPELHFRLSLQEMERPLRVLDTIPPPPPPPPPSESTSSSSQPGPLNPSKQSQILRGARGSGPRPRARRFPPPRRGTFSEEAVLKYGDKGHLEVLEALRSL